MYVCVCVYRGQMVILGILVSWGLLEAREYPVLRESLERL